MKVGFCGTFQPLEVEIAVDSQSNLRPITDLEDTHKKPLLVTSVFCMIECFFWGGGMAWPI